MLTSSLTIALVVLSAPRSSAQGVEPGDPRWAPRLGCWRLVQDDRGPLVATTTVSLGDTVVCVYPASTDQGVSVTTFVGARIVAQQTVVAGGSGRPVSQPGCSGRQRSEWSLTGQQLLTRGEIACHGQPARTISGISLLSAGPTWLDIQAVGKDPDARIRIRRYQRDGGPPEGAVLPADLQKWLMAGTTRSVAPTLMTRDEVVDAFGKIAAPVLEAALRETGSPFDLNSVVGSEAAGVTPEVAETAFAPPNWWSNFDFPYSGSARPVVVVQGGPARPSGSGPHWWGARYSAGSPPSAVVPAAPARPSGGGPNWWGARYVDSPPPSAVVPAAPARPSDGGPSWWGNLYSDDP